MRNRDRKKCVVLGLDGVSWTLIGRLTGEGVMPHLAGLLRESRAGPMNSTRPEISPVAWTTFFTGRSPGEHGIYGFTEFEPGGYGVRFNSSADVKTPWIWDWIGLREGRAVVLNVPLTYPARPLAGVMVSGFVALEYDRAGFPAWVPDYLRRTDYRLEADFERVHQDRKGFLQDLDAALAGRSMLLEKFWPEKWDLFVLVVTDTDRLLHFYYREFLEGGPIAGYFLDFFRRVDETVGRVLGLADETDGEVSLFMLSDHGFAPVRKEFHLNRWLAGSGFQVEIGPGAAAVALDPTRVYINAPPRFPGGRIRPGEAESVAMEVTSRLMNEPAVSGVARGRDLYSGRRVGEAPDLVVLPEPGYEFKARFDQGPIYADSPLMGTHSHQDAFYLHHDFSGRGLDQPIRDVHAFGRVMFDRLGL